MKSIIITLILVIGSIIRLSAQTVNGEILSDSNNITVVRIWGTHEERGFAYGYLVGDKMIEVWNEFIVPHFGPNLQTARALIEEGVHFHIDSIFHEEAKAILNGMGAAGWDTAGLSYIDLLVGTAFNDLDVWINGKDAVGMDCSEMMNWSDATAGTDLNGKSVISRHLDGWFGSIGQYLYDNVVIVIHIPAELNLQSWIDIGYAGTMGPSSGINENGFCIFHTALGDEVWDPDTTVSYEPMRFALRKALETVDYDQNGEYNMMDIRDAISSHTVGFSYGWDFSVLGPSTAMVDSLIAMVAEVAPEPPYITFRTNSFPDSIPGDNLFAANSQIMRNNSYHFCLRYIKIAKALNQLNGIGIGSQLNWDLMRDSANTGNWNMMFFQYIPEWDWLKICVYHDSAAYLNDPVVYDVGEWFNFTPPAVTDLKESEIPIEIVPNPASEMAVIRYRIPNDGFVSLKVINMEGKLISDLVSKEQNQGEYKLQFDASDLPAGIYLISLKAGPGSITRKFIKRF